ncbi:hypothetical protein [Kitasatospora sp. NPDC093679]|uniref:hypothetical protein n=1 Tax=Kitasatospora sp. NPDC093679 TaxID=3154983 RepID=UPI0034288552
MENPFRDGGPLDKAMPYCQSALAVALLGDGLSRWRHGGSVLWALLGGLLMALACYEIYKQLRSRFRR